MKQIICFLCLSNPKGRTLTLMEMEKLKQPLWPDLPDWTGTLSTSITTNYFEKSFRNSRICDPRQPQGRS